MSWLLQKTPILLPPNATIDEMSSLSTVPEPGSANGAPHALSEPVVRLTQIVPPVSQVAHSWPVESFSMTSVSDRTELIVAGNPASSE